MKQTTDTILDHLSGEEALAVLRGLCASDQRTRELVLAEAQGVLGEVSTETVAEHLFSELDLIDVQELWDRAGPSRDGYSSPDEMAVEMIDEVLEPFADKVEDYRKLGMAEQCKLYCMGVLKGLYRFEHESKSEFREWATDTPGECFGAVLDDWRKHAPEAGIKDMEAFLARDCPRWAR